MSLLLNPGSLVDGPAELLDAQPLHNRCLPIYGCQSGHLLNHHSKLRHLDHRQLLHIENSNLLLFPQNRYLRQSHAPQQQLKANASIKWFTPLTVVEERVIDEDIYFEEIEEDYYFQYEEADDDLDDEVYYGGSASVRIGNRRWGDNGYVRAGRQEARPVHRPSFQDSGASSSRKPKKKEQEESKHMTGRRAKRALKREAADKAAEAKHQQHLARFGRK
ncbi:unnamed protein product [Trifolium pratense]|uniref:Uncharacterized protein n=1 Tax=Trifolium pratense TaxID=57577 RepID=A0ACB0L3Q0_TRIPR|nr:unnamed protein product [Trifolium pratense]